MPDILPRNASLQTKPVLTVSARTIFAITPGLALTYDGNVPAALTTPTRGVTLGEAAAGGTVALAVLGEVEIRTDTTWALPGTPVAINSAGKAVPATAGNYVVGRNINTIASAAIDSKLLIMWNPEGTA